MTIKVASIYEMLYYDLQVHKQVYEMLWVVYKNICQQIFLVFLFGGSFFGIFFFFFFYILWHDGFMKETEHHWER